MSGERTPNWRDRLAILKCEAVNAPRRLNRAERRACKRDGHCACEATKPCCYCGSDR